MSSNKISYTTRSQKTGSSSKVDATRSLSLSCQCVENIRLIIADFAGVTYDPIPFAGGGEGNCAPGSVVTPRPNDDLLADDYCCNANLDWEADLIEMARMNVNAVRIYRLDPSKTHARFMAKAESLGIYVILPLTGIEGGILNAGLPSPECYTRELRNFAMRVVRQFSKYPNTLMFTAANELTHHGHQTGTGYACMPCLKALVRDVHAFQKSCGHAMRRVPLM